MLKINNIQMPLPDKNGFTVDIEITYSENAGTSANGLWSGDIKAEKKVVSVTWTGLRGTDANIIFNAISKDLFFLVEYENPLEPLKNISFTARKTQVANYTAITFISQEYILDPITITLVER